MKWSKSAAGMVISLLVHALAFAAIFSAQAVFRDDPVKVIDFSLEKTVFPKPKEQPRPQPKILRKEQPKIVEKKEAFPDTSKADTIPPEPSPVEEPVIATAESSLASPAQPLEIAGISDSVARQTEYITAQYGVIRDKVYHAIVYPLLAQEEGLQGTVKLSFQVNRDGSVESVRVINGSGYKLLDNSAVKAIQRAAPFPRAPDRLEIILPVVYQLK